VRSRSRKDFIEFKPRSIAGPEPNSEPGPAFNQYSQRSPFPPGARRCSYRRDSPAFRSVFSPAINTVVSSISRRTDRGSALRLNQSLVPLIPQSLITPSRKISFRKFAQNYALLCHAHNDSKKGPVHQDRAFPVFKIQSRKKRYKKVHFQRILNAFSHPVFHGEMNDNFIEYNNLQHQKS
jgi:hypothetical protein